jgi:hypothetical protein
VRNVRKAGGAAVELSCRKHYHDSHLVKGIFVVYVQEHSSLDLFHLPTLMHNTNFNAQLQMHNTNFNAQFRELCIEVGKWNKSILWCTVKNIKTFPPVAATFL